MGDGRGGGGNGFRAALVELAGCGLQAGFVGMRGVGGLHAGDFGCEGGVIMGGAGHVGGELGGGAVADNLLLLACGGAVHEDRLACIGGVFGG